MSFSHESEPIIEGSFRVIDEGESNAAASSTSQQEPKRKWIDKVNNVLFDDKWPQELGNTFDETANIFEKSDFADFAGIDPIDMIRDELTEGLDAAFSPEQSTLHQNTIPSKPQGFWGRIKSFIFS